MESDNPILLPGDTIDPSLIPTHKKLPLRLGPGLRHIPPTAIVPTVTGQLVTEPRKNSMWVEYNGGRYIPSQGDLIIGQIHHGGADTYYVSITPHTPHATLPVLAFESATKKTRPILAPGQLVYARVTMANRHMDPELECVSAATGRADGLGPLVDGCVFTVSLGLARRLLMPAKQQGGGGGGGVEVLDLLGESGLAFETAVGRNGKVWVGGEDKRAIVLIGRALRETDDGNLGVKAQKALVRRLLKEMQ